jgi:two-component system chemotaxis response regulator CheB
MATIPGRDIVVVAASAGGLEPLRVMLAGLPADLPASVHIVLHISATGGRALPHILDRAGPLSCESAVDGAPVRHGRVYVAPPDRHTLIADGRTRLSRGPKQNGLRPAADPLFRSAALFGGPRTTAVVLSGTLDDAALGSATVERQGGAVLVQDPAEAAYQGMPQSALAVTQRATVLEAGQLAAAITQLATQPA